METYSEEVERDNSTTFTFKNGYNNTIVIQTQQLTPTITQTDVCIYTTSCVTVIENLTDPTTILKNVNSSTKGTALSETGDTSENIFLYIGIALMVGMLLFVFIYIE